MRFINFVGLIAAGFIASTSAIPTPEPVYEAGSEQCTDPLIRKEWRTLSAVEKANYLHAVKCLMNKPGKLQSYAAGIKTRWEDFVWTHQVWTPKVHFTGQFLPWHRLFLAEYERVLREECSYLGAHPYWDVSKDYADIFASPVLNGRLSFGGNGKHDTNATVPELPGFPVFEYTGGGCIERGPFKDEVIHLGYRDDDSYTERCIKRNIIQGPVTTWQHPGRVRDVLKKTTYEEFSVALEGDFGWAIFGIHNAGHLMISGDMADMWISPSDPLFYIFHGYTDYLWWKWQEANPAKRRFAVGNPIKPRNQLAPWPDAPEGNVTLDFPLSLGPLAGARLDIETARIVDSRGRTPDGTPEGVACYVYE